MVIKNVVQKKEENVKNISINIFYTKIFCISLSYKERWKKVSEQFKKEKIKIERFIAIDSRYKQKKSVYKKSFELAYNIRIPYNKKQI